MDQPRFLGARKTAPDVTTFTGYFPIADLGVLPANSHFIHAKDPILVDTNGVAFQSEFIAALEQVTDLAALRWIFVSHTDLDHIGNLEKVMALAPQAKVVLPGLGAAKMSLREGFDMSRLMPLDHGQQLDLGDRKLVLLKPPTYDAPETTGFFDTKTRVLFSVDSFGALLDRPYEETAEIGDATLRDGMTTWAGIDAPWLGMVDKSRLGALLADIGRLDPAAIISGHLPMTAGSTMHKVLGNMLGALSEDRFRHPDRETIEALFAEPRAA
jgi:glyoxylase-like metal-dependent hydrolase (beta-lactamase superfamily II)